MISKNNFVRQWENTTRSKSWTNYGLEALYDVLCEFHNNDNTNYEDDDPLEDIVAIDCSYAEYTAETLMEEFGDRHLDFDERYIYDLEVAGIDDITQYGRDELQGAIDDVVEDNPKAVITITGMESEDAVANLVNALQGLTHVADAGNDCYIVCTDF